MSEIIAKGEKDSRVTLATPKTSIGGADQGLKWRTFEAGNNNVTVIGNFFPRCKISKL